MLGDMPALELDIFEQPLSDADPFSVIERPGFLISGLVLDLEAKFIKDFCSTDGLPFYCFVDNVVKPVGRISLTYDVIIKFQQLGYYMKLFTEDDEELSLNDPEIAIQFITL